MKRGLTSGKDWPVLACVCLFALFSARCQELRVMSYNIRYDNPGDGENAWTHRKDFLIAQIAYHSPDVFGIQEGLRHQVEALDQGLPGYAYLGRGRDADPEQGEYSAVFYRTDRLEPESGGTFWLSETPDIPSRGWDAALNRICTYGIFRDTQTGRRFGFFNTHFDHRGSVARRESVGLILQKIRELNPEGLPVVLTGDLNLEPDTPAIRELSRQMQDTRILAGDQAFGPSGTFNGFDCTQEVTRRIDYVFISPGDFRVKNQLTLSEMTGSGFPSDHFAVMATLSWPEEP